MLDLNSIFLDHKATLPLVVLGLSLLGSPHCGIMCLPLTYGIAKNKMAYYHIGRLLSYLSLASLVFYLKRFSESFVFLQIFVGFLFLVYLLYLLVKDFRSDCCASKKVIRTPFAILRGILNGFLPCIWLTLFLLSIALQGSIYNVWLLMIVFWLGTVPIFFIRNIRIHLGKRFDFFRNRYVKVIVVFCLFNFSLLLHFTQSPGHTEKSATNLLMCLPTAKQTAK